MPFFVTWLPNGEPDFRIMDAEKMRRCIFERLCWVCGEPLGHFMTFTIGPMCAINRTCGEPPSHRECSEWSARICPFLTNPDQKRNPKKVALEDSEISPPGGFMIPRNPGVVLCWTCEDYAVIGDGRGGVIMRIGEPTDLTFWREGRPATRAEIVDSIESGYPILYEMAAAEGPKAFEALVRAKEKAYALLPA